MPTTMPSSRSKFRQILLALSRYDYRTHRGIAKFAAKHYWHLNCEMAITGRLPLYWNGDGIITMLSDDDSLTRFVVDSQVPFVDLSVMREDIPAERVSANNPAIGQLAGDYFLSRGFKNYAFFSTTHERVSELRQQHFFNVIAHQQRFFADWSAQHNPSSCEHHDYGFLADALVAAPKPLAVFASRDLDASITLDACLRAGLRVPEQVAILGVDNNELITESQQVPLSSVNHDVEGLGNTGAQLLELLLQGKSTTSFSRTISPKGITTRRSTECLAVNDSYVQHALEFMKSELANKTLSATRICDHVSLPRRSLDKRFTSELGHSIHEELIQMRLRQAKHALVYSPLSVEKIALNCGFNTAQYFNSSFRKHTQETPMNYRRSRQIV